MLPVHRDPKTGIVVYFTPQAATKLGVDKVPHFVKVLITMMDALGAHRAYVSKVGEHLAVVIQRPDGWKGYMRGGP